MTQIITCPACKQQLQVPEEFLGQPVKCPGCGVPFTVVAGSSSSAAPAAPLPGATPAEPTPAVPSTIGVPPPTWPQVTAEEKAGAEIRIRGLLVPPAVCLMLIAVLGFLCTTFQVIVTLAMSEEFQERLIQPLPAETRKAFQEQMQMETQPLVIALRILFLFMALVILGGAVAMISRRMHPLAIAGCVFAMIYFNNCCCILGLPVGIWGLMVLMLPDVRASFQ